MAAAAASSSALAQNYPSRPIRVLVPLSAGSLTDVFVRTMAPHMSATLGVPVVVENAPGAGAIVGTVSAAKSAPDGYTVAAAVSSAFSVNPHLHKELPYDPVKDFAPVCRIGGAPYVLAANPALGARSIPDVVAKAKAGSVPFASAGAGSVQQLVQEMFKARVNAPFLHVPYKGTAQAVTDTVAGHAQLLFETPGPLLPHIRSGKLIALGVTSARRLAALPDVPTFEELGFPGFRLRGWIGLAVPAGTPAAIVDRLAQACQGAVAARDVVATAEPQGFELDYAPPAEFATFISSELATFGQLVRLAGVKPE
jgi:tripartite-type tricarboxylate transporter receptor subunit TctC